MTRIAVILLIAEFCPKEKRHIISVFKLIQDLLAPSKVKGRNQFQLLMAKLPDTHKAKWFAGAALNTAEQSMQSVLSTALSRLNSFLDSELEQILCFDTAIDAEMFCKQKTAVFLVMPEEDNTKYFIISLILQQLYREILVVADTRIERAVHGQDSWSREIEVEIPVSNVELWETQICTVERMLKFLTGDLWKIELSSRTWQFSRPDEIGEKSNKYDEVSLFSGGMDSLISTINLMEDGKNTLLISHAGEALTKNAQKNIVNIFDVLYPDVLHTWLDLWMVFPRDYIPEGGNDNNTRSRSFLFIGYALFAMTGMDNINELLVPENGLIALNVPLDETRVGSFSTRTTHPFYLSLWNELLEGLGMNLLVKNPYWNRTKGEMAEECKNKDILYEMMKLSFSCSSPGKARWKQLSQQHCGYCVPCLIRRAAMHKAFGDDGTVYTETSIDEMQNKNSEGMGIQLRSFQYAIDKIKQDRNRALLYIHKPGPLPQDDEYLQELADIYVRGLYEVDNFIQDNLAEEGSNNDL